MDRIVKSLFIFGGIVCVVLGFIGIFIPILPTTPFLLLAAFLFARSSERFLHWLLTNRWFGAYIKNYREGKGMPAREKALTIIMLWLTIGFSSIYIIEVWWVRLLLLAIATGVTTHLLSINTYVPEPKQPREKGSTELE
jgi:uncharacterized protein